MSNKKRSLSAIVPEKLTVARLREILTQHHVRFTTKDRKPALVQQLCELIQEKSKYLSSQPDSPSRRIAHPPHLPPAYTPAYKLTVVQLKAALDAHGLDYGTARRPALVKLYNSLGQHQLQQSYTQPRHLRSADIQRVQDPETEVQDTYSNLDISPHLVVVPKKNRPRQSTTSQGSSQSPTSQVRSNSPTFHTPTQLPTHTSQARDDPPTRQTLSRYRTRQSRGRSPAPQTRSGPPISQAHSDPPIRQTSRRPRTHQTRGRSPAPRAGSQSLTFQARSCSPTCLPCKQLPTDQGCSQSPAPQIRKIRKRSPIPASSASHKKHKSTHDYKRKRRRPKQSTSPHQQEVDFNFCPKTPACFPIVPCKRLDKQITDINPKRVRFEISDHDLSPAMAPTNQKNRYKRKSLSRKPATSKPQPHLPVLILDSTETSGNTNPVVVTDRELISSTLGCASNVLPVNDKPVARKFRPNRPGLIPDSPEISDSNILVGVTGDESSSSPLSCSNNHLSASKGLSNPENSCNNIPVGVTNHESSSSTLSCSNNHLPATEGLSNPIQVWNADQSPHPACDPSAISIGHTSDEESNSPYLSDDSSPEVSLLDSSSDSFDPASPDLLATTWPRRPLTNQPVPDLTPVAQDLPSNVNISPPPAIAPRIRSRSPIDVNFPPQKKPQSTRLLQKPRRKSKRTAPPPAQDSSYNFCPQTPAIPIVPQKRGNDVHENPKPIAKRVRFDKQDIITQSSPPRRKKRGNNRMRKLLCSKNDASKGLTCSASIPPSNVPEISPAPISPSSPPEGRLTCPASMPPVLPEVIDPELRDNQPELLKSAHQPASSSAPLIKSTTQSENTITDKLPPVDSLTVPQIKIYLKKYGCTVGRQDRRARLVAQYNILLNQQSKSLDHNNNILTIDSNEACVSAIDQAAHDEPDDTCPPNSNQATRGEPDPPNLPPPLDLPALPQAEIANFPTPPRLEINDLSYSPSCPTSPCEPMGIDPSHLCNQPSTSAQLVESSPPDPRVRQWLDEVPQDSNEEGAIRFNGCPPSSPNHTPSRQQNCQFHPCSHGSSSKNELKLIAFGINEISSSLQQIQFRIGRDSLPPLGQQPRSLTPSKPSRSSIPGHLRVLVRVHCATLFGKCYNQKLPDPKPPPVAQENNMDIDQNINESSSSVEPRYRHRNHLCDESREDVNGEVDICYPYPDGPGHALASSETLTIIWDEMQKQGIQSFCPDLSRSFNSPSNRFWWNFAIETLCKLVECGEYDTISLENCTRSQIWAALSIHVTETLMRRYKEERKPTSIKERRLRETRRRSRRVKLIRSRVDFLMSHAALTGFIPIVEASCSDDETDEEEDPNNEDVDMDESENTPLHQQSRQKTFNVLRMPWRDDRLTHAVNLIDQLKYPRGTMPTKYGHRPPRIRVRPQNPKESTIPCPSGLLAGCLNHDWLKTQHPSTVVSLQIQPAPPLRTFVRILEAL